jgi:hypothetical protein
MPRLALVASLLLWCLAASAPARAQDTVNDAPAHISVVDGAVVLERDGRSETAPLSMPLLSGDRIRTEGGRAEILFGDGSTLHLDSNTRVDFQSDEVIRLLEGRVRLNIPTAGNAGARNVDYRVDAPSAWVQIVRSGAYRISVLPATPEARDVEVELAVLRGEAALVNEDGQTTLAAGERAFARAGLRPSAPYVFNSASWDAFDRWSENLRDSRLGVSAEYLPETVQPYAATFNEYGYWQNEPTYGYVWYPRVRPGWRPYYYGRWTSLRPWGWTWIGSDPWAWPTHHYGRWGFSAGSWFWIPGATWGPAWVSWAYAPGYVSWCPLGWNNRPVFGFSVGIHSGYRYNPWNAWTVVPHRGFGRGFVNVNVVNSTHIDVNTRNSFVVRDVSPDATGIAVPRSAAPIRSVGVRVPSRSADTAYRGSRTAPGVGTSQSADDAAATFRRRGSSATPLNGNGYPAPSRAPRSIPPTRQGSRSYGAGTSATDSAESSAGATANERRAVPRGVAPSATTSPSASPSNRRTPAEAYSPGTSSRPEVYRAVPRSERPRQEADATLPPVYVGTTQNRSYSSPSPEAAEPGPRAVPRSMPDGRYRTPDSSSAPESYRRAPESSRPPDGYRIPQGYRTPEGPTSRPGPERSSPPPSPAPPPSAGPPPSAAPPPAAARPSGPSSGSSGGGESRSRGGGMSSGRAVPRGGRQ